MRPLIWLVALIAISCASTPPRSPNIELGTIDFPKSQAIFVEWRAPEPPVVRRVSLDFIDKYIVFSPATWESIQNYIDQLESELRQ